MQTEAPVLFRNGFAAAFGSEDITTGNEAGKEARLEPVPERLAFGTGFRKTGAEVFGKVLLIGEKMMAREHGLDGLSMALRNPQTLGVFSHHEDIPGVIGTREEHDGTVRVAIVHGRKPLDAVRQTEAMESREVIEESRRIRGRAGGIRCGCGRPPDDVDIRAQVAEVLAGGQIPIAIEPSLALPAGKIGKLLFVVRIEENVVINPSADETRDGLGAGLPRDDEFLEIPLVTDTAGVGGRVKARSPSRFGSTATGGDVRVFAGRKLGRFLDADDVIFEAEIGINVLLTLVMAEDNAGAVFKEQLAPSGMEAMRQMSEELAPEDFEVLQVGFAHLAQEQTFETRDALAIINAELGEQPVRLTATAGATEADRRGPVRLIAEASGGAGGKLAILKDQPGAGKILQLVLGATVLQTALKGILDSGRKFRTQWS